MNVQQVFLSQVSAKNKRDKKRLAFNGMISKETFYKQQKLFNELEKHGVSKSIDWQYSNVFLQECYLKVVKVFEKLFGNNYLPSRISYENLYSEGTYAVYDHNYDAVIANAEMDSFDNMKKLKKVIKDNNSFFRPNHFSSKHPAHIIVHEFCHAAHFKNWQSIFKNKSETIKRWKDTKNTEVPSSFGRLVTKYKLGSYAITGNDVAEFLAERMAKDICGAMDKKTWELNRIPDVKYETIFDRKWKEHNACPQAYIDYFTQLIWNGQTKGVEPLSEQVELFLYKKRGLIGLMRKIDGTVEEVDIEEQTSPICSFNLFQQQNNTKLNVVPAIKEVKKSFWKTLFNFGTDEDNRLGIREKQFGY